MATKTYIDGVESDNTTWLPMKRPSLKVLSFKSWKVFCLWYWPFKKKTMTMRYWSNAPLFNDGQWHLVHIVKDGK